MTTKPNKELYEITSTGALHCTDVNALLKTKNAKRQLKGIAKLARKSRRGR